MTPCVFLSRRPWAMSMSQDNWHKCHKAGDKSKSMSWDTLRPPLRLAPTPHTVLMWGGSRKDHATRPATGNFSWDSKGCTHAKRVTDVSSASNNDLVHTSTGVKNRVLLIDSALYGPGKTPLCTASGLQGAGQVDSWGRRDTEQNTFKENSEVIRWQGEECQNQQTSRGAVPAGRASCAVSPPSRCGQANGRCCRARC